MRQTLTISLPPTLKRFVDSSVKSGDFSSASEFMRDLLRERQASVALRAVQASDREFRAGKGKVLRSLKSLRSR